MAKEWWNKNSNIPYGSKKFQTILNFYLFNCPVEIKEKNGYKRVSNRGTTFREKDLTGNNIKSFYKEMKGLTKGNSHFIKCANKNEMNENIVNFDNIVSKHDELIIFTDCSDRNDASNVFYSIRNAFAHGSFSVIKNKNNSYTYYLQSSKNGVCKSRMILHDSTLLNWIKLFEKYDNIEKEMILDKNDVIKAA